MLDNGAKFGLSQMDLRARINPEDHPNHIIGNLDALDESTDDVALRRPVRTREPVVHHRGKQVELADHELQRADLLIGFLLGLGFSFQPGCPPAQLGQARLELRLLDQSLRVAVDQPLDRTARLGQLTVESIEFEPMRAWPAPRPGAADTPR